MSIKWRITVLMLVVFFLSSILPGTSGVNAAVNTGKTFYVAQSNGDDINDGSIEKPFKTISKAAEVMAAGDTCLIREGTYRETIKPANNGEKGRPITYKAYGKERVIVSGADVLPGSWEVYKGSIYSTPIGWSMGLGKDQVFVDGTAVVQARFPNSNERRTLPVKYSPLFPTMGYFAVGQDDNNIVRSPSLTQKEKDYWKGAIFVGGQNAVYAWQSAVVSSSTAGELKVEKRSHVFWFPQLHDMNSNHPVMSAGYLTNHINALDKAGEWHIMDGRLYIWMPQGDEPTKHIVEAKKRNLAFDLTDKKYINLYGVEVFAASVTMSGAQYCSMDRCLASYTSHFLLFDDATSGFIENAFNKQPGDAPQRGEAGIYVSGIGNKIVNSTIRYSAGAGIYLAGRDTVIENNRIHDCGYACTYLGLIYAADEVWPDGMSIDQINKRLFGNYRIRYNTLYNVGRSAVNFGSISSRISKFMSSDISYNRIFNTMLFTDDGGAFYAYGVNLGQNGKRTVFHHNLIWDSFRVSVPGAVIYSDNYTEGLDITKNLIWHHPLADPGFMTIKEDGNPNNLPKDKGDNIDLGEIQAITDDIAAKKYPGGKYFKTGADHGEDPFSKPQKEIRATRYEKPAGELSRKGWTASASSSTADYSKPQFAIDPDRENSYWSSANIAQTPGEWFQVDMKAQKEFSRIVLESGNVNSPRSYTVTVSNDGKLWSKAVATGDSCTPHLEIFTKGKQKARFIRITQYAVTNESWGHVWSILDFKVYSR
jgi:parallel beta-helix repeat protein